LAGGRGGPAAWKSKIDAEQTGNPSN